MRLYLVRHPKPRVAPGICYGRLDLELATPAPEAASRIATQLPPGLPLWSSPARRCRDLAEALHPEPPEHRENSAGAKARRRNDGHNLARVDFAGGYEGRAERGNHL